MNLRTSAQLDLFLDNLLAWRKKELTLLRFAVATSVGDKQRMMLRGAVTLLYAHWEGFVKDAATGYVQFVALQGLPYAQLADNFVAIGMKRYIRAAGQSGKTSVHSELVRVFTSQLHVKPRISWRRVVDTASNLNGDVFKEIIVTIGLDFAVYALKAKPVIDRLVKLRNGVAHGRGLPIDVAEYATLHGETLGLLDVLKTELSDAAAAKRFRRAPV